MASATEVEALLKLISSSAMQAVAEYANHGDHTLGLDNPHPLDVKTSVELKKIVRKLGRVLRYLATRSCFRAGMNIRLSPVTKPH